MQGGPLVKIEGNLLDAAAEFAPHDFLHFLEGDVEVVPILGFSGRREDRLLQAVGLPEPFRDLDAADLAGGYVFLPARSGEISPDHAFHREDPGLSDEHRPLFQDFRERPKGRREIRDLRGDQMVRTDQGGEIEPEFGNLGQDFSFVGNEGRQDVIEGGNAVGRDDEQFIVDFKDVSHLPFFMKGETVEFDVTDCLIHDDKE